MRSTCLLYPLISHATRLLILLTALCGSTLNAASPARRAFTVDDLFRLESIGPYTQGGPCAFSMDGECLAFLLNRSRFATPSRQFERIPHYRSDIWIQLEPGTKPFNLTQGQAEGTGAWAPQWSPDGERLAFLSTRGGAVGLWLWDSRSRQFSLLSQRVPIEEDADGQPFAWINNHQLVFPVQPDDKRSRYTNLVQETLDIAGQRWRDALKGNVITANALYANVPTHPNLPRLSQLLLLDLHAAPQTLAEGAFVFWRLAPDRRQVALIQKPADQDVLTANRMEARIVRLDGEGGGLSWPFYGQRIYPKSLSWAPGSDEIAIITKHDPTDDDSAERYSLYRLGWYVSARSLGGLRPTGRLLFAAGQQVIVEASRSDADPAAAPRLDWWRFDLQGRSTKLTGELRQPSQQMPVLETGHRHLLTVADGELWRIQIADGTARNLTASFAPEIRALLWPLQRVSSDDGLPRAGRAFSQVIVGTAEHGGLRPYVARLRWWGSGMRLSPLDKPTSTAELLAYSPANGSAVFHEDDRDGLFVWRSAGLRRTAQLLLRSNQFLREIDAGSWRPIEYTSLKGEPLTGWLLLPHAYQPGTHYPLLTVLEPGQVFDTTPPDARYRINSEHFLNPHIAAGHGYAVLFPSMPLQPYGVPDDPMLRLAEGVMPAVDASIATGVADPDRLFLFGSGIGGFGVNGLLTQSAKRFASAISIGGYCDLFSNYGVFAGQLRYTDRPHLDARGPRDTEGLLRMAAPPWKDPERYARNSPILRIHLIETPVLFIHGDLDYLPLMQSEECFRGMQRENKPAAIMTFVGEGHDIASIPNIRELWTQIFAWLDIGALRPIADATHAVAQ